MDPPPGINAAWLQSDRINKSDSSRPVLSGRGIIYFRTSRLDEESIEWLKQFAAPLRRNFMNLHSVSVCDSLLRDAVPLSFPSENNHSPTRPHQIPCRLFSRMSAVLQVKCFMLDPGAPLVLSACKRILKCNNGHKKFYTSSGCQIILKTSG